MKNLKNILKDLTSGKITNDEAEKIIKTSYIDENINHIDNLDFNRSARTAIPEVIFCQSKTINNIIEISQKFLNNNGYYFLTKLKEDQFTAVQKFYKDNPKYVDYTYEEDSDAKVILMRKTESIKDLDESEYEGKVGLITAGTSDIPVAVEAKFLLNLMEIKTITSYDVGIAGFHRIFTPLKKYIQEDVDVIIVFAGMEGTLPGVVSALVDIPVIAVPISSGYGLGEKGIGALTTMLQSCSPGLSVVNIDNGFGAATMAALICKKIHK